MKETVLEMRRGKIRRKEKPSGGAPLTIETGSLFQIVTNVGVSLTFVIKSTAPTADCPLCGQSSARPQGRYEYGKSRTGSEGSFKAEKYVWLLM